MSRCSDQLSRWQCSLTGLRGGGGPVCCGGRGGENERGNGGSWEETTAPATVAQGRGAEMSLA